MINILEKKYVIGMTISLLFSSCGIQGSISSTASESSSTTSGLGSYLTQGGNVFGAALKMGTNDVQDLFLVTNGSNRLSIPASSNFLGIGTDTPAVELHVHDGGGTTTDLKLTNNSSGITSTDGFTIRLSGVHASLKNYEAGDIYFETNATEKMRILSSGNVGIGVASPQATLDVNGYMKLKKNSSAPVVCSATYDGALAMTSTRTLCVCDGSGWMTVINVAVACTW